MRALPNTAQQQNPKKRTHYCYSNLFFGPFNATGWQFQIKAAVALNLFSLQGCGFPRSDALSCHLTRLEKAQREHSQTFDGNANNGQNYVTLFRLSWWSIQQTLHTYTTDNSAILLPCMSLSIYLLPFVVVPTLLPCMAILGVTQTETWEDDFGSWSGKVIWWRMTLLPAWLAVAFLDRVALFSDFNHLLELLDQVLLPIAVVPLIYWNYAQKTF